MCTSLASMQDYFKQLAERLPTQDDLQEIEIVWKRFIDIQAHVERVIVAPIATSM